MSEMELLASSGKLHCTSERLLQAEAVWKRIFAESAIGTPRHSRSLNGLAYFLEHGGTQAIWVPIYAALQVKIKP
ncbi:hypothetical protein INP81_13115 [Comamonas thiooxydans]|uniref:hypothetical protein n=1 Tax=Comamonas thiooxydans TaxID=363952 RepID=UPI0018A6345F|nr:hypothetical protein [Comamonas thiooxydans]QOQ80351.1 hypothetical protein INP81_13115 [Comamonas thiooxydans]